MAIFFLGVILSTLKHSLSPTWRGDSVLSGRSADEASSGPWRHRCPSQRSTYGAGDLDAQAGGPVIAGG